MSHLFAQKPVTKDGLAVKGPGAKGDQKGPTGKQIIERQREMRRYEQGNGPAPMMTGSGKQTLGA